MALSSREAFDPGSALQLELEEHSQVQGPLEHILVQEPLQPALMGALTGYPMHHVQFSEAEAPYSRSAPSNGPNEHLKPLKHADRTQRYWANSCRHDPCL